jgi:hypothetical protein
VAGEVKFLTPLCSTLQSDKVREAKIADFWLAYSLIEDKRIPQEVRIYAFLLSQGSNL